MSVAKRKTSSGETGEYHYDFSQNGKRYRGVCEGCTTKPAALLYEKRLKEKVKVLSEQKSVGALVENFKRELTGGDKITLDAAFELYLAKPRRKQPSVQQQQINQSQWNDFVAFMHETYPAVEQLDGVSRTHAEAYIRQLRENGRYLRKITYQRAYQGKTVVHSYDAQSRLSGRTINAFHKTLKSVFAKLQEEAGILYNPFEFDMMDNDSESRDAFTPAELKLIGDNLDPFVRPLFVIGICTGLSEGDICTLRWNDIRDERWIVRKRRKTGAALEIPILPPLASFLNEQKSISAAGEYVLPEHAAMYQNNPSGISYRVKSFLEGLGIQTTRTARNRSRASSVKDVHSLRHTFAYLAGCYQIPLPVVQSILGHMSPEMTKHYQAHADREAKEKYLAKMPDFIGYTEVKNIESSENQIRTELIRKIQHMSHEQLIKVVDFVEKLDA
ncbi:tyrosine-type recombinase/integrase [Victivallis sp. Marseille-Q1083]|jgi:phage integrase family protein|uniref:tyrosine-type recombinase/integrase n=1 Tax=Victivallis sp. Marseille-Q1083 TaxID=2717288 RepID=UPI00158B822D|nr:tyrosine-type recombinase/integrase [Victivallis sp. Marseille-Q1083]